MVDSTVPVGHVFGSPPRVVVTVAQNHSLRHSLGFSARDCGLIRMRMDMNGPSDIPFDHPRPREDVTRFATGRNGSLRVMTCVHSEQQTPTRNQGISGWQDAIHFGRVR